jgi:hypothetical protein
MASILNVMNEKLLFMLRFYEGNYLSNSLICSILIQTKRNQYGLIEISIRYYHACVCVYFMREKSLVICTLSHHVSHIYSLLLYGYYHIFNKVPLLLWRHVVIMKLWTYCFFFCLSYFIAAVYSFKYLKEQFCYTLICNWVICFPTEMIF